MACQSLLVIQEETFVAGEELDALELVGSRVDDLEEPEGLLDAGCDLGILGLEFRIADVAQTPVERAVQICNAGGDGGSDVVECRGRVVIRLDEAIRIQLPLLNLEPIQDIPPEARNLLAIHNLRRATPRLGVLPGHPADSDHGLVGAPDEDDAHLQQELDLGLDGALLAVVEELGAVAALEQEGVALGDIAQVGLERVDLVGVDDGRQPGEF